MSSILLTGLGTPNSTLLNVDFSVLTPGAAASSIKGISVARTGAGATVQTGVPTVESGIAINTPRIFSDGTHKGLLIEEARTNLVTNPRAPQSAPWTGTGITANAYAGPDGSMLAARSQCASGASGSMQGPIVIVNGTTYAFSLWMAANSGTIDVCSNLNDGATINAPLFANAVNTAWRFYKRTMLSGSVTGFLFSSEGRDLGAANPQGAEARDQRIDMFMIEAGKFSTSFYDGARGADLASISSAAIVSPSGKLALNIEFYPLAPLASYSGSAVALFLIDSYNNAYITLATRKISVNLGGSVVELPVAIPTWAAFDEVKLFIECGTGVATHAWVSINGTITDLGGSVGQAAVPTGGTFYLLNNASVAFSCVVSKVSSYL